MASRPDAGTCLASCGVSGNLAPFVCFGSLVIKGDVPIPEIQGGGGVGARLVPWLGATG